jgi:hypothetical protein
MFSNYHLHLVVLFVAAMSTGVVVQFLFYCAGVM